MSSTNSRKISNKYDTSIIQQTLFNPLPEKLELMKKYLQEYKAFKKAMRVGIDSPYNSLEAFMSYLREKCIKTISSNEQELANYAIEVTYNDEHYMVEFPWKMFPEALLQNIIENSHDKLQFPVLDDNGEIEYLWNRYSMQHFNIEDIYEN